MSRRRFELIDPSRNSRKFWEIEVSGPEVMTFWGRIGAAPAQKTKKFGTAAKAEAEAEKLVREKEKKGYELVSGARVHGKKASGKKSGGKSKCAHCGKPSGSPTECAEPWEHSYYAGGCDCKFCDAHFNKKLTTSEINWLAQHGWSSKQIKAMKPAEARLLIEAGEHKKPGAETEAASITGAQKKLLVSGVGFAIKNGSFEGICNGVKTGVRRKSPEARRGLRLLLSGFFTDKKRDIVVLPNDYDAMIDVNLALEQASGDAGESLRKSVYRYMLKNFA